MPKPATEPRVGQGWKGTRIQPDSAVGLDVLKSEQVQVDIYIYRYIIYTDIFLSGVG